ncbi:diguanylate cyclase domain-containing protein [Shewanella gelidii]|uniref:GGDEF domain-containing protein n=1 Tax=Shewanella gelidii TaxID=1642821 RepID=A0A917JTD0_9GAMM|nr:diguanylate cyclase [Shewanella gelidii]MCL1098395.1 GGDEF domain-containing protein [Shewanella gelidii]GGI83059.1 hypothetical protein GCM10009332_20430 [Shewanella gelidii]
MAIRLATLSLWLWCALAFAVNNADEEAKAVMDTLDALIFQDIQSASDKLANLKRLIKNENVEDITTLRATLMECLVLVESGKFKSAIEVAQTGDVQSRQLKLERARPYFLNCLAIAHANLDNYKIALPIFDSAAKLAKEYQQSDALITALYQRAQLDTFSDNYASAIQDLKNALDIYSEVKSDDIQWSRPPLALLHAAMSNLLHTTGDFKQAIVFAELSIAQEETTGMLSHILHRNISRLYFDARENKKGEQALLIATSQLSQEQFPPLVLGFSYAIISSIEFSRGNYLTAQQLVLKSQEIFKKLENNIELMRTSRLLAQIKFALGEDEHAIRLMLFAIEQGEKRHLHFDLSIFYEILAAHYEKQNQYKLAFHYLVKQQLANKKVNKKLNDTRLLQFKARLNQHHLAQAENQQSVLQQTTQKSIQLTWAYRLTFTLSLVIIILFIFSLVQRNRGLALARATASASPITREQKLESIFDNALKSRRPLSLVLLDITNIRQVDLPQRLDELKQSLRSQDLLLRYSSSQVIIALPYTTEKGAEFVSQQLSNTISNWQSDTQISIGIGSLQPFDTLPSLIKRANINRLNKAKHQDVKHGR